MSEKALIIAISGCSSSGKTTLARLLRDILPNAFILHQDDFYRPEEQLPSKNGLLDWDCAGAIDVPAMADALSYIRQNASFPPTLDSKEDQNSVGPCPVPDSVVAALKAQIPPSIANSKLRICLLDGFLLYSASMASIHPFLDLKLFLRVSYAKAKARREARDGYATIEGFWTDPPGYVDDIVWPNYVEEHAFLFQDGNVEGDFKSDVLQKEQIHVPAEGKLDSDMSHTLEWMVGLIVDQLEQHEKHGQ